jgi:hypothetical protein
MKTQIFQKSFAAVAVAAGTAFFAINTVAQDSTTAASGATQTMVASQPAPQLSYGVPQVLQLSQAKVGDDTIVAYIKNSGTIYSLDAPQIIYLRQQGVSDRVVTAMLDQRQNVTGTTAPASSTASTAPQQDYTPQTSTAVAQPTVTYVQTVPSSSVYVIPDTQTYDYNAWYYQPYYYPYYAWPYPAVTFSFGFGGGYRGGYYRGGGWHGGGGFHGGGGWHH